MLHINLTFSSKKSYITSLLMLFGLMSFSQYAFAAEETTACTEITSLPAIINVPGIYCFKQKLSTNIASGNAIQIQADDVTIDFNEFKLGGLAAGVGTSAVGVYAGERKNITLRDGNIRGFYQGIHLDSTDADYTNDGGHVIENNRLDGNTFRGIRVEGSNNVVRGNKVRNTGGASSTDVAYGIYSLGPSVRIIDNDVHNTFSDINEAAYGIWVSSGNSAIVLKNRVSETLHANGSGSSFGIYHGNGGYVLFMGNEIFNSSQQGLTALLGNSTIETFCQNNSVVNYASTMNLCFDGGGNVTQP